MSKEMALSGSLKMEFISAQLILSCIEWKKFFMMENQAELSEDRACWILFY